MAPGRAFGWKLLRVRGRVSVLDLRAPGRAPDFIGIGVQKGGTTWLHRQLARHPDIWVPPLKEFHYFDRDLHGLQLVEPSLNKRLEDPAWRSSMVAHLHRLAVSGPADDLAWWTRYYLADQNDDWYRSLFSAPGHCQVGEFTPRYAICDKDGIAWMHRVAPQAKLILVLRDPVERFWSHCRMRSVDQNMPLDSEQTIREFFESPLGRPRGEYLATIRNFCGPYLPSQILIAFQDAIAHAPTQLMTEVFTFLGLDPHVIPKHELEERINVGPIRPMPGTIRQFLLDAYVQEIADLRRIFGGFTIAWGDAKDDRNERSGLETGPPAIRLTTELLSVIHRAAARGVA